MKTRLVSSLGLIVVFAGFLVASSPDVALAGASASNAGWHLTGQVGGRTQALAMQGQILYLGVGLHVEVLNVSNPKQPKMTGSSKVLPDFVEGLYTNGSHYLYAACGPAGLQILDISTPAAPVVVGSYDSPGYAEKVTVVGKYAILADGPDGVQILDISNPRHPVWVGDADTTAYAYDVKVSGHTLYVAEGGSGVLVVDLTYPTKPQVKARISVGGFAYGLALSGSNLYAAAAWRGVAVLDVSTPESPKVVAPINMTGWAMSVTTDGARLLVSAGADGVRLYDLSAKPPRLVSGFQDVGFAMQGTLKGQTAFVTDKERGLLAVDFSKPATPSQLSRYSPMLDARRVTMTGTTAYVAAGLSGMRTIDLSDVNHPNETSWIDTQGGYVNKVIASGKIAYMSCHLDCPYPLQTFDISNPLKPKKIGALKGGSYGRVDGAFRSMSLSNGLLYVAAEQYDLVVNVGKPQAPKAMGWMVVNNVNAAEYGHLMVSVNNDEIQFVDVSNPSALKETAVLERITGGEAVAFLNPRTVAASDGDGIMLIDVSNPHQPLKLGSLAGLGTVMDASVVGTTAYMSSLGAGVKIVDVSNPAKPKLTGTVETPGLAYDSYVHGNLMLVADGYGGLLVYQRGQGQASGADAANALGIVQPAGNTDLQDSGSSLAEPANGFSGLAMSPTTPAFETASPQIASKSCVVSSNADKGSGSLRACLAGATEGTTITFDRSVFPPSKPKIIKLASPLPQIVLNHFTIDASNAGVILDGSQLKSGSGLYIFASYDKIMGLQIVHFPENGIKLQGDFNQIGGNRLTGSAPTGQGNLLSQNALNGVIIWGKKNVVIGNLVGTDVTGSRSLPNQYGVFVSEYGVDTTVGGLKSGEGNLMSGNSSANLDTWGLRTKVIGNVVGLNLQGNRALTPASHSDVIMESGATDNVIGGTVSAARNVISGADFGVIFSDPNTYQNSVIGNYIGTDITGTRAVPNTNGVVIFMTNHNRLGGSAPGEGNLISGNTRGVDLNGYGVSDNIILGNKFGLDSAGRATLPNNIGVSIDTGQTHDAIGGLTRAEGNVFAGGQAAVWISDPGIEYHYVAGNVISNTTVAGIYIGGGASNNFVEGNSISEASSPGIRVDVGTGNRLRANSYNMAPAQAIELEYGGNGGLAAPVIQSATSGVVGTACAGCVVEVYGVTGTKIVYAGEAKADGSGAFQFGACEAIAGKDVVALAIDGLGNTSAFSVELKAAGSG